MTCIYIYIHTSHHRDCAMGHRISHCFFGQGAVVHIHDVKETLRLLDGDPQQPQLLHQARDPEQRGGHKFLNG